MEYALKPLGVTKQLKIAASRPSRYGVLIGPDERAEAVALVRHLQTGVERRVPFAALAEVLRGPDNDSHGREPESEA